MAIVWVECWKCEGCGHRWIKTEIWPAQCAKCRSRKWNLNAGASNAGSDIKLPVQPPAPGATIAPKSARTAGIPIGRVNMQALRDICAGQGSQVVASSAANHPYMGIERGSVEIAICGKTWWEEGEQYECLMDKGHKESKHGMRGMFRSVIS